MEELEGLVVVLEGFVAAVEEGEDVALGLEDVGLAEAVADLFGRVGGLVVVLEGFVVCGPEGEDVALGLEDVGLAEAVADRFGRVGRPGRSAGGLRRLRSRKARTSPWAWRTLAWPRLEPTGLEELEAWS